MVNAQFLAKKIVPMACLCVFLLWQQSSVLHDCKEGDCSDQSSIHSWQVTKIFSYLGECNGVIKTRASNSEVEKNHHQLTGDYKLINYVCLPPGLKPQNAHAKLQTTIIIKE